MNYWLSVSSFAECESDSSSRALSHNTSIFTWIYEPYNEKGMAPNCDRIISQYSRPRSSNRFYCYKSVLTTRPPMQRICFIIQDNLYKNWLLWLAAPIWVIWSLSVLNTHIDIPHRLPATARHPLGHRVLLAPVLKSGEIRENNCFAASGQGLEWLDCNMVKNILLFGWIVKFVCYPPPFVAMLNQDRVYPCGKKSISKWIDGMPNELYLRIYFWQVIRRPWMNSCDQTYLINIRAIHIEIKCIYLAEVSILFLLSILPPPLSHDKVYSCCKQKNRFRSELTANETVYIFIFIFHRLHIDQKWNTCDYNY